MVGSGRWTGRRVVFGFNSFEMSRLAVLCQEASKVPGDIWVGCDSAVVEWCLKVVSEKSRGDSVNRQTYLLARRVGSPGDSGLVPTVDGGRGRQTGRRRGEYGRGQSMEFRIRYGEGDGRGGK